MNKATEQQLRTELSVWQDRLAEAKAHRWDDGIRNCKRHVAQLRREIRAADPFAGIPNAHDEWNERF